jgi:hypothetical protein
MLTDTLKSGASLHPYFELHFSSGTGAYFLAMMTARIGAGSPSIVLL